MIRPGWSGYRRSLWRRAIAALYGVVVLAFVVWGMAGAPGI